jgi:hypothetical protein
VGLPNSEGLHQETPIYRCGARAFLVQRANNH